MAESPGRPPPPKEAGIGPPPTTATLISRDGVAFTAVPAPVARLARVLVPALEAGSSHMTMTIPIPGVAARPLAQALDFLSAQAALQTEVLAQQARRRGRQQGDIDPAAAHAAWATAWVDVLSGPDVAALAAAASFLDAPSLLDLAISSLARRLRRARPPAELRAAFGLPEDLSATEAAAVQADCAGALDAAGW